MIRFLNAQVTLLADPVLATVIETYLWQSIVLLDCCCVNDPCGVLKVLWNKKLEEVSSLAEIAGEKIFRWSEIFLHVWLHVGSLLHTPCSLFLLCLCCACPCYSFQLTEKGRQVTRKIVLQVNSLWLWCLLRSQDSVCFRNAASRGFLDHLCSQGFSQLYYDLFLAEVVKIIIQ